MAREIKPHFCINCGETNPENFYGHSKRECKTCAIKRTTSGKKEYLKEYRIVYDARNKKSIKERKRVYYLNNKEKIKNTQLEYYKKGGLQKKLDYEKKRRSEDPSYKIIKNLRSRQNSVINGRYSTTEGLGCDSKFVREYIESLWEPWMNWDNYGTKKGQWSIDHTIPISSFEKDDYGNWHNNSDYNKKLIHYTNLRPLLHDDNLKKSNKVL